ncbi:MAG: hypothetical protein ACYSSK_07040 [Planctomycetota bacterium]
MVLGLEIRPETLDQGGLRSLKAWPQLVSLLVIVSRSASGCRCTFIIISQPF